MGLKPILTLLFIVFFLHLWLFEVYMPCWYDMSLFHSVTDSLLNGNGFDVWINPLFNSERDMLMHGPVFYLIQAFILTIFGNTHFSFLILGFVVYLLIARFLWKFNEPKIALIALLLISMDAVFGKSIHNGRMDILAGLFAFISYILAVDFKGETKKITLIGLSATLGFLTTPRVAVVLIPIVLYVVYVQFFQAKTTNKIQNIAWLISIPLVLVSVWVFAGFGGFEGFIKYFFKDKTYHHNIEGSLMSKFVGGNWLVVKSQIYISYSLLLMTLYAVIFKREWFKEIWFSLAVAVFLVFHFMVKDVGVYTMLYLPIAYSFVIRIAFRFKPVFRNIYLLGFIAFGMMLFFTKSSFLVLSKDYNHPKNLKEFIVQHTQEGDKILGSNVSYLSAFETKRDFRLWTFMEVPMLENIEHIFKDKDVDYVLFTTFDIRKTKKYTFPVKLEPVATLDLRPAKYIEVKKKLSKTPLAGNFLNDEFDIQGMTLYKVVYPE
jgi:hypothetical protein